jgi:transmembrane 9 superfamily protein 3
MGSKIVLFFIFLLHVFADEHSHHYTRNSTKKYNILAKEDIVIWFNTIGPINNHQETYEYLQLPFCLGSKKNLHRHESLGEALLGIQLINSGMDVHFKEPVNKQALCSKQFLEQDIAIFKYAIENQYWFQAYVDDLPLYGNIGLFKDNKYFLYTHKNFVISTNNDQIIQVNMTSSEPVELGNVKDVTLKFTYSVGTLIIFNLIDWVQTTQPFHSRFKHYLDSSFFEHEIHWWSILNSFIMVLFLVALVIVILLRTLRKDMSRYEKDQGLLELDKVSLTAFIFRILEMNTDGNSYTEMFSERLQACISFHPSMARVCIWQYYVLSSSLILLLEIYMQREQQYSHHVSLSMHSVLLCLVIIVLECMENMEVKHGLKPC